MEKGGFLWKPPFLVVCYSPKLLETSSHRAVTASFSSAPSASSVMVVPLTIPRDSTPSKALGVHATLILLQPDAALELVGLLNEERGRTSMQAYFIVDRNILSIHRYYSLSKKIFRTLSYHIPSGADSSIAISREMARIWQ